MGTYYYYDNDLYGECTGGVSETYKGEWKNGERNGLGTLYNEHNEVIYKGEWKNDRKHGMGTSNEGYYGTYIGEWKNGRKDGIGKMCRDDGTIMYEGEIGRASCRERV